MNKVISSFALITGLMGFLFTAQAQVLEDRKLPSNEIKINIANTIIVGSLELGYEYFIDQNQSIGLEVMFMDRFAYISDSDDDKDFNATSVMLSYNYYFVIAIDPSGFYVLPFLKYRGGTFTEIIDEETMETNLNSIMIGFGTGYKWVHNDKFVLGPYVNIARGFNSEVSERFAPVEVNAGFSIGFRF
ncbi:MAG: DUF3575 domain-containing protein [Cyclobacteriaceae bacterium]